MKHRLVGIGTPNARTIISLLPCTTKRKSDIGTMTDVTVEASRGCFVIGTPKPNVELKIVVDAPKGTVPLEIGWVCEGWSGASPVPGALRGGCELDCRWKSMKPIDSMRWMASGSAGGSYDPRRDEGVTRRIQAIVSSGTAESWRIPAPAPSMFPQAMMRSSALPTTRLCRPEVIRIAETSNSCSS